MQHAGENASQSGESQSDNEMGSHESFDLVIQQDFQIKKLEEELKIKEDFQKHLLWHCMMYREALKKTQGGCKALRDVLNDFNLDNSEFHSCACCEYEYYKDLLQNFYKKPQQVFDGDSQAQKNQCANCQNDGMIIPITDISNQNKSQ